MSSGLPADRRRRLLVAAVAASVAVAFADSSIVVLALPDLYGAFNTSIVGVSWVITSYNLVVAVVACADRPVRRGGSTSGSLAGSDWLLFTAASIGCAASWSLAGADRLPLPPGRRAPRCSSPASLPLLGGLLGSRDARVGSLDDCRTSSVRRSGRCSAACSRSSSTGARSSPSRRRWPRSRARTRRATRRAARGGGGRAAARGALAADVGARPPLRRARRCALPGRPARDHRLGARADRRRARRQRAACSRRSPRGRSRGAARPPAGGAAEAQCSSPRGLVCARAAARVIERARRGLALAFCGVGLGLAVPVLTRASSRPDDGLVRDGTITIGARHAGLVVALALVAPLLSHDLEHGRPATRCSAGRR